MVRFQTGSGHIKRTIGPRGKREVPNHSGEGTSTQKNRLLKLVVNARGMHAHLACALLSLPGVWRSWSAVDNSGSVVL